MSERVTDDDVAEARNADLVSLISVNVRLRRRGRAWWGCCPFHKERSASFKVEDGRYKCFGCGKSGDAIQWVLESEKITFLEAVKKLSGKHYDGKVTRTYFAGIRISPNHDKDQATKFARARKIWDESISTKGTMAEAYLRGRGIKLPPQAELRFHESLDESTTKQRYPALVARLSDARGFCAIQRVYLDPDGNGKARLDAPKRSLGAMRGGAVRFRMPSQGYLGLAEGIETALSAMQLYAIPVWAMCGLRYAAIDLPDGIECLTLYADPGEAGTAAAYEAQEKFEAQGLPNVEVVLPAAHFGPQAGGDFNDVLKAGRS